MWNYKVGLGDKPSERSKGVSNFGGLDGSSNREHRSTECQEPVLRMWNNASGFRLNTSKAVKSSPVKILGKETSETFDNSGGASEIKAQKDSSSLRKLGKAVKGRESDRAVVASESLLDTATDLTLPTEVNKLKLLVHPFLIYF